MKNLSLVSLALIAAGFQGSALANDTAEVIEVVGSRLEIRSATDTTSPVDLISSEQLTATGMSELSQALQFIAPSFSFPSSSVTDGSDAVRPATLRGMSPDHTLVLVNGKRYHKSALVHLSGTVGKGSSNVDLNTIPMSAVKRVEILRDGASARYGSDAIAGVINIILKDDAAGTTVEASTGITSESDGEQYQLSVNHGFSLGEQGYLNATLELHERQPTNRAGLDPRQQYPLLENGEPDPREETFDRLNHKVGDADYSNQSLWLNGGYSLAEGELTGYLGLSRRETESGGFYRRAKDSRNVIEVYPDGFLPMITTEILDFSANLGYSRTIGNWELDLSLTHGANSFEFGVSNSINASLGPTSPTSADAGELKLDDTVVNAELSRDLPFYNQSDLILVLGAEYHREGYEIVAGEEVSYIKGDYQGKAGGIQVFSGFTPDSEVDESRHNNALFVEVENQLTDEFQWAAAWRFEDYSDFGTNNSVKLSARYDISDALAIRSTFNTGFRAPSVQQLYFTNISTLFDPDPVTGEFVPVESGTFNSVSPVTQALGVPDLKPETSENLSLGLVFQPLDDLSLTLDLYRIDVEDRIVMSGSFKASSDDRIAALLADTNAQSARFFSNALDTRTEGIEVAANYSLSLDELGDLGFNAAYQHNSTELTSDIQAPRNLIGFGEQTIFDHREQVRMTEAQPKNKGVIGVDHRLGAWSGSVRVNYFGSYTIGYSKEDVTYGSKWVTDLAANYRLTEQLQLSAGINNLFDEYPDKRPDDNNFNGIFVYPLTNAPFGFNGRYYRVGLSYQF